MAFPQLPSFFEDEFFSQGQKQLQKVGTDFLSGNVPEFFREIGESGGPQFEDLLRLNEEQITRSGFESAARLGTRGGATQSNIMKNIRASNIPLRFADFTRALRGKETILNTGLKAATGVRDAGLEFGGQKNRFNLGVSQIEQQNARFDIQQEQDKQDAKDQLWSQIISGALGAAGTIGGALIGGPAGAAIGGSLGSAAGKTLVGSGNTSGLSNAMDFEFNLRR